MSRIILGTTLAWLVVTTVLVVAQGRGIAAQSPMARATPAQTSQRILPGTRADVFATIQGTALTYADRPLSGALVRARDARAGQIVEWQISDGAGLFAFRSVNPGSYVVEIVGADESSVLAASQVLHVAAGQVVSTIVKLPFRTGGLSSIFGTASSAAAVVSQAAASGVLATQVAGAATCDTLQ